MLDAIEKYKKYKSDKKVQKAITKAQEKIARHQLSIERKKILALQKSQDDVNIKYEKQRARFLRRSNEQLEKVIRRYINVKPLKKREVSMKQKAFKEFQLYCRISRADDRWYITMVDNLKKVHYTECQWGHFYPKHNYPHIAFSAINCRPISRQCNKMQWDNVGERWRDNLVLMIGKMPVIELDELAGDKDAKNQIFHNTYYREQYEFYKAKNAIEKRRLWKYIKKL